MKGEGSKRLIDELAAVMKRELNVKAKLWIYQSLYVLTLTHDHYPEFVTKRTTLQVQSSEMGLLRRVAVLSLRNRVRSSPIREGLKV